MVKRPRHAAFSHLHLLTICILFMQPSGCSRPAPPQEPTESAVASQDIDILWDSALSVLRKLDFQPDRQDRAAGIITTFPTTSMQWHEPWRQDVADGYSLAMSSLHTIQRKVTIRFLREQQWVIDVQVEMFILSAPDYQITTASSAIRSFAGDLPTVTGETALGAASREWVSMGRDGYMEARILDRVLSY
ncbi:hypothetical protein B7486_05010 [cyanobacterium TDX16]|nr:hypothetical protein B7486_05010 [cyanobacterium TDX16]